MDVLRSLTSLRRKIRGAIQRYGTVSAKEKLWDTEFSSGRWDCLDEMDGDCLYPVIERYGEGRAILDLGCGPGATANEIDGSYVWYTGVDISRVALEKARLRSIENQRNLRCEYIRSDMALYEPNRRYDVIVFGDSLYYVPRKKIPEMLRRYAGYLSPTGVFIARIKGVRSEWFSDGVPEGREGARWTTQRSVVSIIRKECAVIESRLYAYSEMICVIVFCPLSR